MPRKTSQRSAAVAEAKNEGGAPRRSGRAVTKQETTTSKEASRSRRSSTAAQTAASVADSRTPRAKGGSRRESTSPSEAPASRVKSARRSTGRINYKESDGEEEVSNTKFDENFESGEDLEESESDEKSKTRGRSRSAKAPSKSAEKSKRSSGSRRGRPSKKKEEEEEEENETFDVTDDSNEPEEVPVKRGRAAKEKEPAKPARSRRQKAEVTEVKSKAATEEKSRQTRRSGRGSTNKEESPKKRPTRGVQAKRYAEDDDDEIEEISDSKADEDEVVEMKETDGRKRKRGASPEEANKRLKDADDGHEEEQSKEVEEKEEKDIIEDKKESTEDKKSSEEPMEVDASDSAEISETTKVEDVKGEKSEVVKEEEKADKTDQEPVEEKMEQECTKMEQDVVSAPKEKQSSEDKMDGVKSPSKEESIPNSDSDKKTELSSSEMDGSSNVKAVDKPKTIDTPVDEVKTDQPKVEKIPEPISQPTEQKSEKGNAPPPQTPLVSEAKLEKSSDTKSELPLDATSKANNEIPKNDNATQEEKNVSPIEETAVPSVAPIPSTPPKESTVDTTLNGAEQSSSTQNSTNEILNDTTPNVNSEHAESNTPKANGAPHNDVQHTNSPLKDQYYLLPGRKYVINSKLNENVRQSVKNNMFGFVSFNLGTPDSDAYLQKDKLLNELSKLDAHVICLQQVAKPFYNAVLEPSLDALGFKSIFSQPQDSLKGMATFYKSSLFRLNGKSDISLRELVEKEIEASPLDSEQKAAVKSHVRRCGSVLFTHFSTVIGTQTITVANVQIPRSDFSSHALQVSCLAEEVIRINGGTNKPLLLGGEFNIAENDASYQLLRDGYLNNEMIEELQQRKDVVLPDNKHDSLVNLLWKSFQHPSSNLCSCYHSVLDHEFIIPELKTASPDLLWYSSDSLHTVGVLDVVSDKTGDHHLSLKADIAFSI